MHDDRNQRTYRVRTEVLTKGREDLGLSLEELAARAAVSVNTIKRWQKGEPATLRRLSRVALVLRIPCRNLILTQEDYPAPAMDAPEVKETQDLAGFYLCVIQIPVSSRDFNPKKQIPEVLEHLESLIQAKGEISIKFVRSGSVRIGLAFSDPDDVKSLVRYLCGGFEQIEIEMHPDGMLKIHSCDFTLNGLDLSETIARQLQSVLFDPTHEIRTNLLQSLRDTSKTTWDLYFCTEHFHGGILIRHQQPSVLTIQPVIFRAYFPMTAGILELANRLSYPPVLIGELPDWFIEQITAQNPNASPLAELRNSLHPL